MLPARSVLGDYDLQDVESFAALVSRIISFLKQSFGQGNRDEAKKKHPEETHRHCYRSSAKFIDLKYLFFN